MNKKSVKFMAGIVGICAFVAKTYSAGNNEIVPSYQHNIAFNRQDTERISDSDIENQEGNDAKIYNIWVQKNNLKIVIVNKDEKYLLPYVCSTLTNLAITVVGGVSVFFITNKIFS